MSSRFIALPLPSGESFLLETDHDERTIVILVDSGRRSGEPHPLVDAIATSAPHINKIDIAICTHQDADHANGFRTFADHWYGKGGTIGEFWLPGRWAAAVPTVLTNPAELIRRIQNGATQTVQQFLSAGGDDQSRGYRAADDFLRHQHALDKVSSAFSECAVGEQSAPPSNEDRLTRLATSLGLGPKGAANLRMELEETDTTPDELLRIAARKLQFDPYWLFGESYPRLEMTALMLHALDTAKSISAIAHAALRFDIPIRWFDFGLFELHKKPAGGIRGLLEPVCAVELLRPPPRVPDDALFLALALSRQNVESLVFSRMETDKEPSVLFVGDSRLSFGISSPQKDFGLPPNSPKRQIIATAAHHGSRVNDNAYHVINQWTSSTTKPPIYVRNGGMRGQSLHDFKNQKLQRCAFCTQCPGCDKAQRVVFGTVGNEWSWPPLDGLACGIAR